MLRYVALGDSYTIGTSVDQVDRWPDQLVARLAGGPTPVALVANLGVNGYTSRDVIVRELPRLADLRPGLATLLIGVNDVVQRVPEATYRANLEIIFEALLAILASDRVLVVTTGTIAPPAALSVAT